MFLNNSHTFPEDFRLLVLVDDLGRHILLLHLIESLQELIFLVGGGLALLNGPLQVVLRQRYGSIFLIVHHLFVVFDKARGQIINFVVIDFGHL